MQSKLIMSQHLVFLDTIYIKSDAIKNSKLKVNLNAIQ